MERRRFPAADPRFRPAAAMPDSPPERPLVWDVTVWWRALAASADGAFVLTGDGRISQWNMAATRITGFETAEVLGRRCCQVFVGRDTKGNAFCSASCRMFSQIKHGEPVPTFDLQTTAKSGRVIWLSMSTIVLTGPGARVSYVIRTFRDVTAVREVLALVHHRFAGTPEVDDRFGRLTRREVEVLRLMASGATNRGMAHRLHVSPATIRNHTHKIFEKLGVANRLAAVTCAMSQLFF